MDLFEQSDIKATNLPTVLKTLHSYIGHDRWFIAGGYALSQLKNTPFGDIDVYFYNESDIYAIDTTEPSISLSGCAITNYDIFEKLVQFITSRTGSPDEVLNTFDLLCCRTAILSDGSTYTHSTFQPLPILSLQTLGTDTIRRAVKYSTRLKAPFDLTNAFDLVLEDPEKKVALGYDTDKKHPIKNMLLSLSSLDSKYSLQILSTLDTPRFELLHDLFFRNFIHADIINKPEFSNLSLHMQARVYYKIQISPPEQISNAFPEYFI